RRHGAEMIHITQMHEQILSMICQLVRWQHCTNWRVLVHRLGHGAAITAGQRAHREGRFGTFNALLSMRAYSAAAPCKRGKLMGDDRLPPQRGAEPTGVGPAGVDPTGGLEVFEIAGTIKWFDI